MGHFRGTSRGNFQSFKRGNFKKGNNFNRGGRGGRNSGFRDQGPPESVIEVGSFIHECEGDIVVKLSINKIPYNNAFVYLENKLSVGKIDEIFGSVNSPYFSVKLGEGFHAHSFVKMQPLFIDPSKLLPMERFMPGTNLPKSSKVAHNTSSGIGARQNMGSGRGRANNKFGNSRGSSQRNQGTFRGGNRGNRSFGRFGPTNKFRN